MIDQRVEKKSQKNNITLTTSWQHGEPTPAFRQLMMLLLQPIETRKKDKDGSD